MARIKVDLYYDDEAKKFEAVDPETGECFSLTSSSKKVSSKKAKLEESTDPQLTLLDNKYSLNSAAVELLGVQPDDRIDIKFEKAGPVIGTDENFGTKTGNRLTKTFTVSYRGKANQELAVYGTVFSIVPHTSKIGLFSLIGDKVPEKLTGDENIQEPKDEESFDSELDDLLNEDNKEETQIHTFDFNLNNL